MIPRANANMVEIIVITLTQTLSLKGEGVVAGGLKSRRICTLFGRRHA